MQLTRAQEGLMSQLLAKRIDVINSELAEVFNNVTDQDIINAATTNNELEIRTRPPLKGLLKPFNFIFDDLFLTKTIEKKPPSVQTLSELSSVLDFRDRCKNLGVDLNHVRSPKISDTTVFYADAFVNKI